MSQHKYFLQNSLLKAKCYNNNDNNNKWLYSYHTVLTKFYLGTLLN